MQAYRHSAAAPQEFFSQRFLQQNLNRIPILHSYHLARNETSPVIVLPGSWANEACPKANKPKRTREATRDRLSRWVSGTWFSTARGF